ncbi:MAG: low molecular weight protein-tyrosine-phosphatase [Verrucomicrobiota bacterium]
MAPPNWPRRILLVCMGNICRSPTAEGVLRQHAKLNRAEIEFDSAGTENYHLGCPPDPRSIHHAKLRGYDLSPLRARQVELSDFAHYDIILAADEINLRALRPQCPAEHQHKLVLFLGTEALPDPYYGEAEDFEKVLDLVEIRAKYLLTSWQRRN